ncbi:MAG: M15 family metallopeptidase [Gemmatimonadaceae bacterium]
MFTAVVGRTETHLCAPSDGSSFGASVHRDVVTSLRALRASASEAGFEVALASGFRGFDRQLSIWNRKVSGELPVLDSTGQPIDITTLSERALVFAILRWSALPGASRHHWGTDIDVYDAVRTPPDYVVQLIPAEVDPGGMHAPLHAWLDAQIAAGTSSGFFRPYGRDLGGVAPERWHLSFAPLAGAYMRLLTRELLRTTITDSYMQLKDVVLAELDEIYERFVINVSEPPFVVAST